MFMIKNYIMDRQISVSTIRKKKLRLGIRILAFVLLIILVIQVIRSFIHPSVFLSDIKTAVAETGDIEGSVTASGTVLPEFEEVITSPVTSQILKIYRNVGDIVKPGDTVLILDTKNEQFQLEKMLEELASKQNRIKKMQLNMERSLIETQTSYEIQRLRTENVENHYKAEKYIKELGGSTSEMVRQAELNLQIARIELNRLEQGIENHRESLITDIKDIEYEINIHNKNIEEIRGKIRASVIRASAPGVITYINDKIGTTVLAGSDLLKLADLSSFKIEGSISDYYMNSLSINANTKAVINDSVLTGKIVSVNPTIDNGSVRFIVRLDNKSHPSLRSNQKVDLFIATSYKDKVVRLPRGNYLTGNTTGYMFVLSHDRAVRREVKFGDNSFNFVEIKEGINPGETVIISNMEDKIHFTEIKLKTN